MCEVFLLANGPFFELGVHRFSGKFRLGHCIYSQLLASDLLFLSIVEDFTLPDSHAISNHGKALSRSNDPRSKDSQKGL